MDSAVRSRLDKHIISAQAKIFRNTTGGTFELMLDWGRGYSGLSVPTFNVLLPFKPTGLTDETLADTAAFFSSRNTLYAIELVHDRLPQGPDFLYQRRYLALPPQPAMALTRPPTFPALSLDITVEPVTTVATLSAFCSLQNAVFDFSIPDLRKRFPVSQIKESKIRHYLAFYQEQPVGAGTIVYAEGVASVWNVGTLDQFRRQGVAICLLQRMLTDAAQAGYTIIMLYSSAQAFKFFSRIGFEIFTQRQWFLPQNIEYETDESLLDG